MPEDISSQKLDYPASQREMISGSFQQLNVWMTERLRDKETKSLVNA